MKTHTLLSSIRRDGNAEFAVETALTADAEIDIPEVALNASAVAKTITFAFTIASLAELLFLSTVDCSIVLKDSGGSAIGDPIVLVANQKWHWHAELNPALDLADLFDSDPATLAVTNTGAGTPAGTLTIVGLYDATP